MQPIKLTEVFEQNARAYVDGYRYIINQGSARSSKTYSILQLLHFIAKKPKKRIISVVSKTLPHLKRGALRDFQDYLITTGQYDDKAYNRSTLTFKFGDSIIEFFSVDQPAKVYGAARDILFVNEVNSISEDIFIQLAIRTKEKIFVDFNPTHEFYIHTDYMKRPNANFIHSTFRQNPYLSKEIINELLTAGERNENFRKVFVEGEIGSIEGVVFENWEVGEFDDSLQYIYGQDFGFVNDPTTLVKVALDNKRKLLYVSECYYAAGMTTNQIYEANDRYAGRSLIVADSAEPRLIEELRARGNNIVAAKKGQGSVSAGLMSMLDYKIIVDPNSHNLMNELRNYIWLDGRSKIVIDAYNHCIDAARYAFTHLNSNNIVIA
jgi:phage terminase large subunit